MSTLCLTFISRYSVSLPGQSNETMNALPKDHIELAISEFRKGERYHKTESIFSADFDHALISYAEGNFTICASILIKCFRIAENELRREDYKVCRPLRSIEVHQGGGTVWDQSENAYYLGIMIDTLHDASIVMLLANSPYSPGQDIFAIEHSLKTTTDYLLDRVKRHEANTPISNLLPLKDPLGEALEAADTTRNAAFIMGQICLRKIRLSHLNRLESQEIENKIAGMICVITLASDDQNWKSKYGLSSLQSARKLAHGRAASGLFRGSIWIKHCADAFKAVGDSENCDRREEESDDD